MYQPRMLTFKMLMVMSCIMTLTACSKISMTTSGTGAPQPDENASTAVLTLDPVKLEDIKQWNGDDFAEALPAFVRSCDKIEKRNPQTRFGKDERMGTVAQWISICKDARIIRPGNKIEAKYFFESRFIAYEAGNLSEPEGLFTGYYEPELDGNWAPGSKYRIPIISRPTDLVSINLGAHRKELSGTQLAGRVVNNKLVPYFSRAEINAGALKGRELEILWVSDAIDAFFLHIQGSGRVRLPDGSHVRIGYAGRNGRRYTSIGRELVGMGKMALKNVTAPAIRDWLRRHPAAGAALMDKNESYVFFRVVEGEGPLGAQGVPLSPGRSLAVDRAFLPLGVPIWLDTTDPLNDEAPIRRIVIAQDTGSAIKGPVRGDVFWGFGKEAARRAGLMKQPGKYYLLLPKEAQKFSPPS